MKKFTFFLFLISLPTLLSAQRIFTVTVKGENRTYLYAQKSSNKEEANQPLVIVLHPGQENAYAAYKSLKAHWDTLEQPVHLAFPNAINSKWDCEPQYGIVNDAELIHTIIEDAFTNFHINRNKVYVLFGDGSSCLSDVYQSLYPNTVSGTSHFKAIDSTLVTQVNHFLEVKQEKETPKEQSYALWRPPVTDLEPKEDPMDSLIKHTLHKRWVLTLHTGRLFLLGNVKTDISDGTYVDLSDANAFLGLQVTRWMNDTIGWFFDISRLKVPETQVSSGNVNAMGSGVVMPITIGFKYAFMYGKFRPYAFLGTGPMTLMVFGGRLYSSGSTGMMRPSMNHEMRTVFHTSLGGGADVRIGRYVILGGEVRYIHSAEFDSAGSIDAIRGFNFNISASFILNADRKKSILSLMPSKK